MAVSREKLWADLKDRRFEPVYVLYGAETFLRDKAAAAISDLAFGDGDFRDFNDDRFSLNIPENLTSALAAANQLPMMAERRVVRITEVCVSSSAAKDTLKENAEDALSAYLADPCPTSIVIFIADELNNNRKLGKMLRSQPAAVEFRKPDFAEVSKWARSVFDKAGASIEPKALQRLVTLSGCDVRRVTTEAEKLVTAAIPGKTVDSKLVELFVRDASEITNFDFSNHLIAGRKNEAVAALRKSLADGEEPLALLGSLAWKFREELKKTDPARPTVSAERMAFALERIAEVDLAIKTSIGGGGPIGSRMQIEMLVCKLAL